jgi:dienelactone hydrolase
MAVDDEHRPWRSYAKFRADDLGSVDAALQKSLGGSYSGLSPSGLFWSMHIAENLTNGPSIFVRKNASSDSVSFEAEVGGRIVASSILERRFFAPGTTTRDLKVGGETVEETEKIGGAPAEGHIARLFIPPGRGPHPAVTVLAGSGGGFDLDKAAILSSHGFATLALAYFGLPPLPSWLHRVPLDYVEAALAWLAGQPEIDSGRIAVLGISRGAELALLAAATLPQIRVVVAYAPSSTVWAAGGRDKDTGELIPTWTWRDAPVTFAPLPLRGFMLRSAVPVVLLRRPVVFRNLFRKARQNHEEVARAAIHVENIRGPVLLVSGGDDRVWPAAEMSEEIVSRLRQRGFTHAVEHLHYPRAGHNLRYPHLPTTSRHSRNQHLRNAKFSYGGAAVADAEAQLDSWRRAIAFLQRYL